MADNLPPQWHRRISDLTGPTGTDAKLVVKVADGAPPDAEILAELSTGVLKVVAGTGDLETAVNGVDYSLVQRQSVSVSLATLQAAGAVLTSSFNVGASLPANARVLAAELVVTQAFAGLGLAAAVGTVQGGSDAAGSLVNAAVLMTLGSYALGLNPYPSRGGQQVTLTVTNTGLNLSGLTAGALTVNLFYAAIA